MKRYAISRQNRLRIGLGAVILTLLSATGIVVAPTPSTAAPVGLLQLPPRSMPDRMFAPVDRPGPPLEPSKLTMSNALHCSGAIRSSSKPVVLFVHGTSLTPRHYDWNWLPALTSIGRAYCTIALPNHAMGDAQISGQYVVHAIREVFARSGNRKIQILGHSQGGLLPRFALRFWPDTRAMVDDVVTFAATNHGSTPINVTICGIECAAAAKQQTAGSMFTQAVNSRAETFAGISYTQIYTHLDELVQPNIDHRGTSSLRTGGGLITNIAIQDVCPKAASEHILVGTSDPIAYRLALDALNHNGPANPNRISRSVCTAKFMPAVDPRTFAAKLASLNVDIAKQLITAPAVKAEPRLASHVFDQR